LRHFGPILCATLALPAASPRTPQHFRLPNGLQIRLVEDHDRPLVRFQFRTTWDPKLGDGREGFLAKLLVTAGAGDLNREAFLRGMEENALTLRFLPGPGSFTWSMLSTSQTLDPAFHHLAMMVSRPYLDAPAMESLQRRLLDEPGNARDRAESEFLRSLGDFDALGFSGLSAFQFDDVLRLRRRLLRPEHSVLVLQGDLTLDQARQMAALHFGAWGPGTEMIAEGNRPGGSTAPNGTRGWYAEAPGNPVEIQMGAPLPEGDSHQRLTGALAARMLRREIAAGAPSHLTLKAGAEGPWVIQATLNPNQDAVKAIVSIQTLLAQWRGRHWTETELALERRLWRTEVLARALHPWEQVEGVTGQTEADPLAGLESVKPEEIREVLLHWLEPSRLRWLVLGGNLETQTLSEKTGLPPLQKVE
jgi:hypothetical protein